MGEYCIGEMIKRTRKMNNMSQEDLAFEICSVSTLSRIENGIENPSRTTLEKMFERLTGKNIFSLSDTTEDAAYRLRHLIIRNVIRNQEEQNSVLLEEYEDLGRDDKFMTYIEASELFEEKDFDGCVILLKSIFEDKGIREDTNDMDYIILEPFEVHAFVLFARCLREKGDHKKAERILNSLKRYLEENNNFDGIRGEMYIYILTEYAGLMVEKGDCSEGLALCALALNEIECREKTFLKKRIFDIKARAYKLKGKQELENEYKRYAGVLSEFIKSCQVERKRTMAVPIFYC